MPSVANRPAPVSAPAMRAESDVMRDIPIAPVNCSCGTVSAINAARRPRSDGRTSPIAATSTSTITGVSAPAKASVIRVVAMVA